MSRWAACSPIPMNNCRDCPVGFPAHGNWTTLTSWTCWSRWRPIRANARNDADPWYLVVVHCQPRTLRWLLWHYLLGMAKLTGEFYWCLHWSPQRRPTENAVEPTGTSTGRMFPVYIEVTYHDPTGSIKEIKPVAAEIPSWLKANLPGQYPCLPNGVTEKAAWENIYMVEVRSCPETPLLPC